MNFILERNYLESYCDAGTVRVKETNFGGNKILGNMPKLVPFKINFFVNREKEFHQIHFSYQIVALQNLSRRRHPEILK